MTVQEALERLAVEYGVEAIAHPARVELCRGDGSAPPLESLPIWRVVRKRQRDPELIAELHTWDEARESGRRSAAFRWAGRVTPAGCWSWASTHRPDLPDELDLRDELDAAFDGIHAAFGEADPYTLSLALLRFRGVVLAAIAAYEATSRTAEREAACATGSCRR
ncbi:MAG: hypothetical protein ACREK5_04855 [Gemmatimonadota bacterium]